MLFDPGMEASVGPRTESGPGVASAALRVLASGSRGNCSILGVRTGARRRFALIDAGLSPLRTRRLLGAMKLTLDDIDEILLTHLDSDHCSAGWARGLPSHIAVRLHADHVGRARRAGLPSDQLVPFDDAFTLQSGVTTRPILVSHDSAGVAAFRFETGAGALGFATDVGRVTPGLVRHLKGVDTLAIESNYCPQMQIASRRPAFLKQRIMGGAGHLSNEECREAVKAISPAQHVVLLHLSQDCNQPDRARQAHTSAPYKLTISRQDKPTPWIHVAKDAATTAPPTIAR